MNRSSASSISLTLSEFSELQTAELEEALRSDNLRCLFMDLDNYDGVANLDVFLRALENAPNIVVLSGTGASPDTIGQFLNVIARNSNIRMLDLANLLFPATSLASLLRVSDSVLRLFIKGCEVAEAAGLWEDHFVSALNGNRVLEYFSLHDSDVAYMTTVVEQLGSHPNLKVLAFTGNSPDGERRQPSPPTSNVIRSLLENRTSSTLRIECQVFCSAPERVFFRLLEVPSMANCNNDLLLQQLLFRWGF